METSGAFTVFLRSIVYLLYLCSMLPIHSMIDTSEKLFQIFTFHYVTRKKNKQSHLKKKHLTFPKCHFLLCLSTSPVLILETKSISPNYKMQITFF